MFTVQVQRASKRFYREWIFKSLDLELSSGDSLAIVGGNGTGKSTLLKCISGALPLSQGSIAFLNNGTALPEETWYQYLSMATPYMELPEEFTLKELLSFHFKFKKPLNQLSNKEIIEILGLEKHQNKFISQYSSGMRQRVKLALAVFSDVPLLLVDEPTINLDKQGLTWYLELIKNYTRDRISVVCSNEPREFEHCTKKLSLEDYK